MNSAFPSRKMKDCELAHTFCFWKLFRTFTGKMTRGLSLRMVSSLLFQDTLLNGALLKKTERKLKSPLGAHRITEQPRRHGSSARYIRDPMTQGYRPGGACRSCGTIPRKSSRSPGPFLVVSHYTIWTTVITLQIPPVTYAPR